jgi:hypothetical protein
LPFANTVQDRVAKWIYTPMKAIGNKKCSGCPKKNEDFFTMVSDSEDMEDEDYGIVNANVTEFTEVLMPSEIPVDTEGLSKILTDRGTATAGVIDAAEIKAAGLAIRKVKSGNQTNSNREALAELLDSGEDEWIMSAPASTPNPMSNCELHLNLDLSKCYQCKKDYIVSKAMTSCISKSGTDWVGVRIFGDTTSKAGECQLGYQAAIQKDEAGFVCFKPSPKCDSNVPQEVMVIDYNKYVIQWRQTAAAAANAD